VAQLEVSCWACHAMHKVVALASSSRPPLACWRISAVWSVCIEQWLYPECCLAFLCTDLVLVFAAVPVSHAGVVFLVLSPVQVRGPSGLARILPRGDGVVQTGVTNRNFAPAFPPGNMDAAVFAVLQRS